jgi:hypothetical protein
MHEMYMFTKTQHGDNGLYNTQDHLWYRDKDFDPPYTTPNDSDCYWSRGNGWIFAALVRVMDVIPDTLECREEYLTTFKEMAEALIKVQREDGFWNPSLADPYDYGSKETSGTAFFAYGLAWGINQGILDSATYMPHLVKGWNAIAYEALHSDGFLGYVQSTGKQPGDGYPFTYDKPANFEDFGLGAFLLAGSETYKLAPDTGSMPAFKPIEKPVSSVGRMSEFTDNSLFQIYPNPAMDQVNLKIVSTKPGELEIGLMNTLGELIYFERKAVSSGQSIIIIDLRGLLKGMYMVRIKLGSDSRIIKFFKY